LEHEAEAKLKFPKSAGRDPIPMGEKEIIAIIQRAVEAPYGQLQRANAEEYLIGQVERNRFNTERAIEVYTVAVDNSVWAYMKAIPSEKLMYVTYQRTRLGKEYAIYMAEKYKAQFMVPLKDQRTPRRFLRFLLGA
jgi:hypothetical protein